MRRGAGQGGDDDAEHRQLPAGCVVPAAGSGKRAWVSPLLCSSEALGGELCCAESVILWGDPMQVQEHIEYIGKDFAVDILRKAVAELCTR